MINYYDKYLKYKAKYTSIKIFKMSNPCIAYDNKYNTLDNRRCQVSINNRFGTCWTIALLIILFAGDSTSSCIYENLSVDIDMNRLIDNAYNKLNILLPNKNFHSYKTDLYNLLQFIKDRLNNKLSIDITNPTILSIPYLLTDPTNPSPMKRTISESCELNIVLSFSKILYDSIDIYNLFDMFNQVFKGGGDVDDFFLINLLSSVLLNRFINLKIIEHGTKISKIKKLFSNTIGIYLSIPNHKVSFYICNNTQKYCNNNIIIDYDWYSFFNAYNKVCNNKVCNNIQFIGVYIDWNISTEDRGPILITYNIYTSKYTYKYFDITETKNKSLETIENLYTVMDKVYNFYCLTNNDDDTTFYSYNYNYYLIYYIINNYTDLFLELFNDCRSKKLIVDGIIMKYIINYKNYDAFGLLLEYDDIDYNRIVMIKELIKNKIDINYKYRNDNTLLHFFCDKNNLEAVTLLLENGANPNILNNDNKTPLYMACEDNKIDIVQKLIDNGADLNIKYQFGNTLLHISYNENEINLFELLLGNRANPNILNDNNMTPLYMACEDNKLDIVQILIDNGADLNIKYQFGNTLLHISYNENVINLFKLLLENRANPNILNDNNMTPLYMACEDNKLDIVQILIDNGADLNIKYQFGNTLLHISYNENQINLYDLLLKNGADPNILNDNNEKPNKY